MSLDEAWASFLSELSEYEAWDHDFVPNPHSPDRMMKKLVDEHGASAASLLTEALGNRNGEVAHWAAVGLGYIGPGAGKNAATTLATFSTRVAAEALHDVDPGLWWKEQHREIERVLEAQVRVGVDQSVAFMKRAAKEVSDEVLAALLMNHLHRDAWTADPSADATGTECSSTAAWYAVQMLGERSTTNGAIASGLEGALAPIATLLGRIVERWHPEQVWLFGSRARGDAQANSDWDVLVVVPDDTHDAEFDPLVGWRLQRDSGVRADVFPCRASDFLEDRGTPNTLAFEAAVDGVLVYER